MHPGKASQSYRGIAMADPFENAIGFEFVEPAAYDLGAMGKDRVFGFGRVGAYAVVKLLRGW